MSEPFIGQIMLFAGNFPPRGWAMCEGQLLSISQNTALFSLLGTTYGGDGKTTFGLPDLRGRGALGAGQGPGLSNISLGESAGTENVTQNQSTLAAHTHAITGTATPTVHGNGRGELESVANAVPASASSGTPYASSPDRSTTMNAGMITIALSASAGTTGAGQPMNIRNPYLAMTYCIALQGIYPSRS